MRTFLLLALLTACISNKDAELQALIPNEVTYGCVKLCEIEYNKCLEEYQEWSCNMSLKRCVRNCLKEEEKNNKDK